MSLVDRVYQADCDDVTYCEDSERKEMEEHKLLIGKDVVLWQHSAVASNPHDRKQEDEADNYGGYYANILPYFDFFVKEVDKEWDWSAHQSHNLEPEDKVDAPSQFLLHLGVLKREDILEYDCNLEVAEWE